MARTQQRKLLRDTVLSQTLSAIRAAARVRGRMHARTGTPAAP